jgi:lysine-N-methylase
MPPIRHLPVLQNWDCHVCGTCCRDAYQVRLTEEEQRRIESQGWDAERDLGGHAPFQRVGPFWARRTALNHRPDGSCVFLSERGRCRIHERFGYDAKPLPCRLFPFILVPAGDRWVVGMRYACPSAAANKGRALPEHHKALQAFAAELAQREGLAPRPQDGGALTAPPPLGGGQRVSWPELHRFVEALLAILRNRRDPLERRLRKCLTFGREVRQLKLSEVEPGRLPELLEVMRGVADAETAPNPMLVPRPGRMGRLLFRLAAALFTRKDHGINRGQARRSRLALLRAAWRFARGTGAVPRLHAAIPEATFEEAEEPRGPLPDDAEQALERYYITKVGSLQFFGPALYGLPFWEGLNLLALTCPVILWTSRLFRDRSRLEAVQVALSVVDDHFGFNRVFGTLRQRLSVRILARNDDLGRLIAWYSR